MNDEPESTTDAELIHRLTVAINGVRRARRNNNRQEFWAYLEEIENIINTIMGGD